MKRIFIILATCLAMAMLMFGCGSNPTPTDTADTFLTAIKAGDTETIKTVYGGDDFDLLTVVDDETESENSGLSDDEYFEKTLLPMLQDFDYELSNEKIDGDKATVDVKITTYDFGSAFVAFMEDYFTKAFELAFDGASDEEIEKLANSIFEEKIGELKDKTYTETVPLNLVSRDGVWKIAEIDEDSDFMNAICGNLVKVIDELEDAFDE